MKTIIGDNLDIIKRFFKTAKIHRGYTIMIFISSMLGHAIELLMPIFVANAVQELTFKNRSAVFLNLIFLGLAYLVYELVWFINYWSYARNSSFVFKSMNDRIMEKIMTYDINFSDKISKSTILNTINNDINGMASLMGHASEMLVVIFKIIVMVVVFLSTNIWIGLAVITLQYIYVRLLNHNNVKIVKHLAEQNKYRDQITGVIGQILNGFLDVGTLNIQNKVKKNFNVLVEKWSKKYIKRRRYVGLNAVAVELVSEIGLVALYVILALVVLGGNLELAKMLFLVAYFKEIADELRTLMGYSRELREFDVSIRRVMRLFNYQNLEKLEFGDLELGEIDGTVRFRNVGFTYKAKNSGSVSDISFVARPNQVTAIVGYSGSGKTTLVNLLLRRHKIDKGSITIDGRNIYDYSSVAYAQNVASVNQAPFMFDLSIRKNLGLIEPNFKKQVEVCKRVGIHDHISGLVNGYNTLLTENAANFGEGNRQLLAVVRALLTEAEILIFDEVSSMMDVEMVEKIKEILNDLRQDKTVILVTHQKEMMRLADKIIVMHNGLIMGEGTHEELMKTNEYYINIQRSSYIEENKEELIAIDKNNDEIERQIVKSNK